MTHEEYVGKLVKLQDEEGKRISAMTLVALKRILKVSGNLNKFIRIVVIIKPKLLKEIALELRSSVGQARNLGKKFGESKLV